VGASLARKGTSGGGGAKRHERQWESAKVERWEGRIRGLVGEWTGGRGEMREAVGRCKSAKVER
jgi:hypothetical protein